MTMLQNNYIFYYDIIFTSINANTLLLIPTTIITIILRFYNIFILTIASTCWVKNGLKLTNIEI